MFIAITTPQNPLRLENTLRPYKKGEKPFTPEVATQILQSTNHKKNIYDTLQLIASLLKEEQACYKDIILSAFEHREQPADTILLGKKLAASHGFENELNAIINTTPVYTSAATQSQKVIACSDEKPYLDDFPKDAVIIFTNSKVDLSGMLQCSLDNEPLKLAIFKEGTKLNLSNNECLPKNLDTYVSKCDEVDLSHSILRYYLNGGGQYVSHSLLTFKEGAVVNLSHCPQMPYQLDIAKCRKVDLSNSNLSNLNELVLSGEANLENATLPALTLDVSGCDKVNLQNIKVSIGSHCQTIIFKNKKQMKESGFTAPDRWQGKIRYTEEQSPLTRLKSIFTR